MEIEKIVILDDNDVCLTDSGGYRNISEVIGREMWHATHLVILASRKLQDVVILKNRYGTRNDPRILNFYRERYGYDST